MILRTARLLALIVTCLPLGPTVARAETVLFACSENCPLALFEALELELRGHGVFMVARNDPSGFSVEAHEADARRMAGIMPAAAVLWIERETPLRVRVFAAKAAGVREAPLPQTPEAIGPRVFAAIAGSVVLEAIQAPGHESTAPAAPTPSAPQTAAAAPAPSAPQTAPAAPVLPLPSPISESAQRNWFARSDQEPARFFLRVGPALGLVYLKRGLHTDRQPTRELVNSALEAARTSGNDETLAEHLKDNGFDCDVRPGGVAGSFVASDCRAALRSPGLSLSPGIEITAGANLSARVALALALRLAPDAGRGTMGHVLIGAQVEYTLTQPRATGFWANIGLGLGVGRIQVKVPSPRSSLYVTSGMFEAHALLGVGYRFLRYFGLYVTPTVRLLFPERLTVFEPNLGIEGRL